jgi:hypothetical protein
MEEAHQHEVLQIGGATLLPPHDVVSLRESSRPAAREAALDVAIAELAHHGGRRLPGQPSESHRFSARVFQHRLHPRVAQQAARRLRVDSSASFDFGCAVGSDEVAEPSMDDNGRTIRVGVDRDAIGAEGNERVGSAGCCVLGVIFTRHHRDRVAHTLERSGDDRPLGRGQLRLEAEAVPVVHAPPVDEPSMFGVANILDRPANLQIRPTLDGCARDEPGP